MPGEEDVLAILVRRGANLILIPEPLMIRCLIENGMFAPDAVSRPITAESIWT
jgi:hypothetical protein